MKRTKDPQNGPAAPAAAAPDFRLLPLARIKPSGLNPRQHFDESGLAELAESIKAKGVLQPVLVRPEKRPAAKSGPLKDVVELTGDFQLVAGERRYRAAKLAGLAEIPAVVRNLGDREVLEIAVVENDQREDVSPLERAEGYARLVEEHGVSVEDLAGRIGKSPSTVRGLLKLRALPANARAALEAGTIPASTAGLLARIPDAQARARAAAEVLAPRRWEEDPQPLSYREAKAHIEHGYMVELKGAPFPRQALDLVEPAGSCDACPKRVGNLQRTDPEAYAGVRADVCTDPACYRTKEATWKARTLADAEVEGRRILPDKEAARLFPYGPHLASGAPYFDLAEPCHEDRKGKRPRSYQQLLGPHLAGADVVLAVDRQGQLHRLVGKDKALPVLREQHGLCQPTAYSSNPRTTEEERREKAQRLAENRLRRETNRALLAAAAAAAERLFAGLPADHPPTNQVLRALASASLANCWGSVQEDVCGRRGLKAQGVAGQREALGKVIHAAGAPQLLGLLTEFVAGRAWTGGGGSKDGQALASALGIDRKGIERAVKDRLKVDKKAKKATRPAPAGGGPAPVFRTALLADLVDGQPAMFDALEAAGLRTAGDLLDRAASEAGPEAQRPYTVLRAVPGLDVAAALALGDALIDAGLVGAGRPQRVEGLGVSVEQLARAYLGDKFDHPKPGKPVKTHPFELEGRLWVQVGGLLQGDYREWELLPLYPAREFEERFLHYPTKYAPDLADDADAARREYYTGVVVQVKGREYAIGPRAEGRTVCKGERP